MHVTANDGPESWPERGVGRRFVHPVHESANDEHFRALIPGLEGRYVHPMQALEMPG